MKARRKSYGPPSEADLRQLKKLKFFEHPEVGIAQAMHFCATHRISPPEWLIEEAALIMIELLKREKGNGRGRTATVLARFKHAYWDRQRHDAVVEVRRGREVAKHYDRELKADPNLATDDFKRILKERRKLLKQDNFECATMLLNGTIADASPSAVRASYRKVKRARANGSNMTSTHFDPDFLGKLGVQDLWAEKGARKTLFFLT